MKSQKGFTLFEIITAMSLFVVVILLTNTLYVLGQRSYRTSMNKSELVQNARVSLDRLSRELRQAKTLITDLSTTTAHEIFFQDGHNLDEVTYIRYYLDGTDMKRSHLAYSFTSDPGVYVYRSAVDAFGNPPDENALEDRIVGEYYSALGFSGTSTNGLIDISLQLDKNDEEFDIGTKIFLRDW